MNDLTSKACSTKTNAPIGTILVSMDILKIEKLSVLNFMGISYIALELRWQLQLIMNAPRQQLTSFPFCKRPVIVSMVKPNSCLTVYATQRSPLHIGNIIKFKYVNISATIWLTC